MCPSSQEKSVRKTAKKNATVAAPLNAGVLPTGVVGIGLMGSSIVACLLAAGHPVAALSLDPNERRTARRRVLRHLREAEQAGLMHETSEAAMQRLQVSGDYEILKGCEIVIESIIEDLDAKHAVISKIEEVCSLKAIIASNTSALPITKIQEGAKSPSRILGLHWGMPCHLSAFMEVIRGEETRPIVVKRAVAFGYLWRKEPTVVHKDIRGFIVNRIGYAMLREAFALVEAGVATPADIDRSVRHSMGPWLAYAGLFRYLDLSGLPPYATIMRDLLPDLDCSKEVPPSLEALIKSGARGVANGKGFYPYTPQEARRWEEGFAEFRRDFIAFLRDYNGNDAPAPPKRKRIKKAAKS